MAVTTFDAGRGEVTVKDLIARAAFVVIQKAYDAYNAYEQVAKRRETEVQLSRLPDSLLQDIGLERADIRRAARSL